MTKRFYLIYFISLFFTTCLMAQPAVWFGDITTADNSQFVNTSLYDRGVTVATPAIQADITKTNAKYLFITAQGVYNPKWTGSGTDKLRAVNAKLNGAAFYGQDEFWQEDFETEITNGLYYTFVIGKNSLTNNDMSVLETTYSPVSIDTVYQNPESLNVFSAHDVVITAELSQAAHVGEHVYLRYTVDGWNTSVFASMTTAGGGIYTCTIPAMNPGTHVRYYVLTTINDTPLHDDIDYLTLKLNNNSGLNYQYMVQGQSSNSGIYDRKIVFNEGTNYYNDFSVTHMGTYGNTAQLSLKGGRIETWKSGTDDILDAAMYYRIYPQGFFPLPVFDTIVLPWRFDLNNPNNQVWMNDTLSTLILYGLPDGDYVIDVYYEAFYTDGIDNLIHTDDNNGSYYQLTFEIDNSIYYGTHSIVESHVIIDTTQSVHITADDWHNSNLGVFIDNDNLVLKGGLVETLKTGSHDITGAKMYYRYYSLPFMPPLPSFSLIDLPWKEDLSYPGNQLWGNDTMVIDVFDGLTSGNYKFEVYFELNYKIGLIPDILTFTDNNGGLYYGSTFTYTTTVGMDKNTDINAVKIYPNPAKDFVYVDLSSLEKDVLVSVTVYDILGKQLSVYEISEENFVILTTEGMTAGLYIIEIYTHNGSFRKKIIIE